MEEELKVMKETMEAVPEMPEALHALVGKLSRDEEMWEPLDSLASNSESHEMTSALEYLRCDACGDKITEYPFSNLGILDLCAKCGEPEAAEKWIKDLFENHSEELDRLAFSEEEKPRRWPCVACNRRLGGGCKWTVLTINGGQKFDVCQDCGASSSTFAAKFEKFTEHVYLVHRVSSPVRVLLQHKNGRRAPTPEVTPDRIQEWAELLQSLARAPPVSAFGSWTQWSLMTNFYELPGFAASCAFAVECVPPFRVASVALDDHGRLGVELAFETFQEYEDALKEWRAELNEEHRAAQEEKVKDDLRSRSRCGDDDMAEACEEFSGYEAFLESLFPRDLVLVVLEYDPPLEKSEEIRLALTKYERLHGYNRLAFRLDWNLGKRTRAKYIHQFDWMMANFEITPEDLQKLLHKSKWWLWWWRHDSVAYQHDNVAIRQALDHFQYSRFVYHENCHFTAFRPCTCHPSYFHTF